MSKAQQKHLAGETVSVVRMIDGKLVYGGQVPKSPPKPAKQEILDTPPQLEQEQPKIAAPIDYEMLHNESIDHVKRAIEKHRAALETKINTTLLRRAIVVNNAAALLLELVARPGVNSVELHHANGFLSFHLPRGATESPGRDEQQRVPNPGPISVKDIKKIADSICKRVGELTAEDSGKAIPFGIGEIKEGGAVSMDKVRISLIVRADS